MDITRNVSETLVVKSNDQAGKSWFTFRSVQLQGRINANDLRDILDFMFASEYLELDNAQCLEPYLSSCLVVRGRRNHDTNQIESFISPSPPPLPVFLQI